MADPIGAPTFAQMFSPSKSPFHAISLAALICLASVFRSGLSGYGTGLALLILIGASVLAPAFRPTYSDRVYGLSLMFGRSAGLIGGLICIGILVNGGLSSSAEYGGPLAVGSDMFQLLWVTIVFHTICMGSLFLFRTRESAQNISQFNIIQFCLMHTTLLIFIVGIARGQNNFGSSPERQILSSGGYAILQAPLQIFMSVRIQPTAVIYALMLLWCVSGLINVLMLAEVLERGWVGDHGEADTEYSKS